MVAIPKLRTASSWSICGNPALLPESIKGITKVKKLLHDFQERLAIVLVFAEVDIDPSSPRNVASSPTNETWLVCRKTGFNLTTSQKVIQN